MIGKIVDKRYLTRGFSALQMLYWCSIGSSNTYMVSYVTAVRGASASLTGLMLAVYMLCSCLGQYLINSICDRMQNNRKVFIGGMLASLALWFGVFFSPNMGLLFVFYGLLGFLQPTMAAVLDTWLIRSFPNDPGAYSPIRSLASLAYSGLMLVMGVAIGAVGHIVMVILPTLFTIGAAFMARYMPEIPPIDRTPSKAALPSMRLSSLHPVVWTMIAGMAFIGIANMPMLNMNLLVVENVGGTVTHSGIAISFNTIAEFLTMRFFFRWLQRVSARTQIVLASFTYVLSMAMLLLAGTIPLLYVAMFINGISYGVILPARRRFITETVPEELHNRMHGIGDIAYNSVGGLVGNQVSGMMIDRWGAKSMLGFGLALESIALVLSLSMKRLQKSKKGIDSAA